MDLFITCLIVQCVDHRTSSASPPLTTLRLSACRRSQTQRVGVASMAPSPAATPQGTTTPWAARTGGRPRRSDRPATHVPRAPARASSSSLTRTSSMTFKSRRCRYRYSQGHGLRQGFAWCNLARVQPGRGGNQGGALHGATRRPVFEYPQNPIQLNFAGDVRV